ncbi:MAG: Clp protease N-terminal domain-containing protein [Anaerolineae bacterium]|nr:Clp protease N-terminal domain-containing protein [Anaerolineae bacterium]
MSKHQSAMRCYRNGLDLRQMRLWHLERTAVEESILAGNPCVRTEHLLLAILSQKESPALDILKRLNISPEQIEKAGRDSL